MAWPPAAPPRGAVLPLWALCAAAPAAAHSFDCEAGRANWRDGWSEHKKEWCCGRGSSAGCDDPQVVFRFVGFGDAHEARRACKHGARVAMPKSQGEVAEFRRTIDEARRVGNLTKRWPRNTVWLGGSWDFDARKWRWDDGTVIGQHWAAKNHLDHIGRSGTLQRRAQEHEPWLCTEVMSAPWPAGQWQDSLARHEFGIVCQEWTVATTTRTVVTTTSATDVSLTTRTVTTTPEPFVVTTPKPFDCRQFRLHWKRAWTDEKKDYCCRTEGVGCIFDCNEGVLHWEEGWSQEKKLWCCEAEDLGCPGVSEATPEIAEEDPPEAVFEAESPLPSMPYDCGAGLASTDESGRAAPAARRQLLEWSPDKKDWCCTHERRGCEAEALLHGDTAAEQEVHAAAPHDCDAGLATWEVGWSADKKDWCCTYELRGCPQATMVFAKFSPQPVPRPHGAVWVLATVAVVAAGAVAAAAAAAFGLRRLRGRAVRSPRAAALRAAGDEPEAMLMAPSATA